MGIKLILDTINVRLDALEAAAFGQPRRRLSKARLAEEESVSPRTIDRRVAEGKLPAADDIVGGRLYWWSDSLERFRKRGQPDTPAARRARNPQLRGKPTMHASPET